MSLTSNQYKMHGYAVFVLQEIRKQELFNMDPLELDWSFLMNYRPEEIVPLLKKRKNKETRKLKRKLIAVVSASKTNIIQTIVDTHYSNLQASHHQVSQVDSNTPV